MTEARKRVAIYTRVSTKGQSVENQRVDLLDVAKHRGWIVQGEYSDAGISGTKGRDQRPALDTMLKALTRGEVDMVAAWSVDRIGRSLTHLVAFLGDLKAARCDLYLHKQGLDTSTSGGRALFQMLGVFAEFEREIIVERVNAGLKRSRLHGTRSGKPHGRPKLDAKIEAKVRALLETGKGMGKIARELGIGGGTVQRIAKGS